MVVAGVVLEDDVEIEDMFIERVVVPFRNCQYSGRKRVPGNATNATNVLVNIDHEFLRTFVWPPNWGNLTAKHYCCRIHDVVTLVESSILVFFPNQHTESLSQTYQQP